MKLAKKRKKKRVLNFDFLQHEAAGGVILCIAAILALIVANSPFGTEYDHLLHTPITIGIPPAGLTKSALHWINDGLMVIFFFLVGLEIKRELLVGALKSAKTAALPAIAAAGGMAVPAIIYATINWNDPIALHGWAIPAATDIAFAMGVLAVLGSRVPVALKVFLLALAIIDDLGAILIIAFFYTSDLSFIALGLAAFGSLVLFALNRQHVTHIWPYLLVGAFVWVCVLESGVHATLAGVITALAIPLAAGSPEREGPLEKLEHAIGPWVSFAILPIFAFGNAGVSLAGISLADLTASVPLGIALGLLIGKPLGIYTFSLAAIRSGLASMPEGANKKQLFGASVLAGIGFTMSLFIGILAFKDPAMGNHVRLGVLSGSLLSAILGYILLTLVTEPVPKNGNQTQ
ncbi:MAG: Na+/H+ antiporter NhaA [Hyphomicrobiaceae bacterium]|nr:Na+/H+ antiporter NhaA [Hyphomicrobiaceae bacterium]